jgi:hypothetical protein
VFITVAALSVYYREWHLIVNVVNFVTLSINIPNSFYIAGHRGLFTLIGMSVLYFLYSLIPIIWQYYLSLLDLGR